MTTYWKFLLCCVAGLVLRTELKAQLSGTYNIPANYSSLALAINALNTQGVSGPVFIELNAGYAETAPSGGYTLTATGSAVNTITFRRTGAGVNPLITAYSGGSGTPASAVQDGVWRIIGSDYITIDGIDINDPNTTNPSTMEFGIGFFKASASDGCQNNTVKNCTINLKTINNATGSGPAADGSRGINLVNSLNASQTTAVTPVSFAGTHSNNKFYANTIKNCNVSLALIGYAAPSPFTLADTGNDIGGLSASTGNSFINFGGVAGATNPAAGIRTLAQYGLNISYNTLNNNDGTGSNHVSTLRGIFVNTAASANVVIQNNTVSINAGGSAAQVSAIENLAGATAANNTISITNNLIQSCSNAVNTTGSFYGIYNNGASASYLQVSGNRLTGISTKATTGSNFIIYNTGVIAVSIDISNNQIDNCSNAATSSGAYYTIYNNAATSAALNVSGNTFSSNSSSASTGNTHIIYNSSATAGSVSFDNNSNSNCSHTVTSTGAFYGLYNAGASGAALEMKTNSFLSLQVSAFSGPTHLFYNSAAITNSVTFSNNTVSSCTSAISSSGSYYGIYNNAASSGQLAVSNNIFNGNVHSVTSGSVHVIFNRGAATNTFAVVSLDNNLVSNYNFTASSGGPFLGIYNSLVTSGNLSLSNNTLTGNAWSGASSPKYLLYNTGVVSSILNLNNNLVNNSTILNNTTGTFNGINNSGNCTVAINMYGNSFSAISNSATTGATNLMLNSGAVAGGVITISNNAVYNFSNTATGLGDFYGISNSGTTFSDLEATSNTYTGNIILSSTGVIAMIYNTGAVATSISVVNMSNNLLSGNTSSVNSTGSFYGIYNNGSSCGALSLNTNTIINHNSYASAGANHLIYNRGVATNTFSTVNLNNNYISGCSFSATGAAGFYSLWNNGVTTTITSICNNTITGSYWNTSTALRYLLSNWGVAAGTASISNNLVTSCTHTNNTTGFLYTIYNNANTTVSSGDLVITNNTFSNNSTAATTGETHYINSSGVITNTFNSITINNNLLANNNGTVNGAGLFYGIYNNSASTNSLNISQNTFTSAALTTSTGSTYFIFNRGLAGNIFSTVTASNNLWTSLTHSSIANGNLFGIVNSGAAATTCALLSLVNNTFVNAVSSGTSGNITLLNNSCPTTNSITISNNVFSDITNTITTTGNFFAINNSGASSLGDLSISNNTFRNLISTSSTGSNHKIYNSGAITNSTSISGNLVANCNQSVSSTGGLYGIFNNNALSGLSVNLSNNTFTNNVFNCSTGSVYMILNQGIGTSTLSNVNFVNNVVDSHSGAATGGAFYGLYNTGFTCGNLSMLTNTLSNITMSTTGTVQQLITNVAKVINALSINNNVLTAYTNTINISGGFFGIVNTENFAGGTFPLSGDISNNKIQNITLNASSGSIYGINSSGIVTNTIGVLSFSNNLLSNLNASISAGGSFYGINNSAISIGNLSLNSNTFTNLGISSPSSSRYMMFNGGSIVSSGNLSNNLLSGITSTLNGAGAYYGINNGGNSQGDLTISNNTIQNHTLNATSGSAQPIYNSGIISNTLNIANNLISAISHSASSSGGFFGIYNNAGSSASLNIVTNTLTNLGVFSSSGPFYLIHNRAAVAGTAGVLNMTNNSMSATGYTSASGQFCGVINSGLAFANMSISNNTFVNTVATTTSGARYFLYNTGVGSVSASIANNFVSGFTSSLNTTGSFYGVNNGGNQSGDLNISGNSFSGITLAASSGSAFAVLNTGNVASNITMANNALSGLTHSASTSGGFLGWCNSAGSSSGLSITGNTLTNASLYTSTGATHFIYNRGAASSTINSINFQNNITSTITYSATSGPFYGAYNNATSFSTLSISGNSFNTITSASSTSPRYFFYNTGAGSSSIGFSTNMVSGFTSSVNTLGVFYNVQNSGTCSGNLDISSNSFVNEYLPFTTAAGYMINNTGLISGSITVNANLVSNITHSSSTGAFYGIYTNAASCGNLAVTNNTLSSITTTNLVNPKYLIYNTSASANNISLSGNNVLNYSAGLNTTGNFSGIYNTGNVQSNLDINNNQLSNVLIPSTTGTCYLICNTGTVTTANINNNSASGITNSVGASGTFYGIYSPLNASLSALSVSGNTLSNLAVNVPSASVYMIYAFATPSLQINSISMNNNLVSALNNTLGTGNFYGVYNNGISSSGLSLSGNTFTNCVSSTTGSVRYMVYNTGSVTGNMNLSNNRVANCTSSLNIAANFYGVYNSANGTGNLSMSGNALSGNFLDGTTANNFFVCNSGTVSGNIDMNTNLVANNTNSNTSSGNSYGVYNFGGSSMLAMNNNSVTGNISNATSADTYLIYNTGANTSSISMSGNLLGQSFVNSTSDYYGTLYGIYNTGGTSTTSLSVNSNSFSGFSFPSVSGSGSIYFIRNTNNNSVLDFSGNSWASLSLNHIGSEYLMYNPSSTSGLLTVQNNAVSNYTRTAIASALAVYYGSGNSPSSCTQIFSGNSFSGISAGTQGTGSFYGIYNMDGSSSSLPVKQIYNNTISNVNYNGLGFFYGYYFDFLGDNTSSGSSVYSNTLSGISWAGPLYGLYSGGNVSSSFAANVYSNSVLSLTTSGTTADLFGAYLLGGGNGLNFYKNKISDLSSTGILGKASGIYVSTAVNTNLSNNLIGNIYTPSTSAANPLNGIYVAGGTRVNSYYNTVKLNANSTGSVFSSNALYANSSVILDLRNSILINTSTPTGAGITSAFMLSSSSLANYASSSNNNVFYTGIPATNRVVFVDGTNTYQTITSYQTHVSPRDNASVSEDTPFLSSVGTNTNFLHVDVTVPSLTESGAVNISGITDDVDSQVRQGNPGYTGTGTAPDIGADEYAQNLTPCTGASAGTVVVPALSSRCAGEAVYMLSTGYTAAGNIVQQWKVSSSSSSGPFANVSGGTGGNTAAYTSNTLVAGVYYFILTTTCTNVAITATSNVVTVTINAVPSASASVLTPTICSSQDFVLGGTSNTGINYNWTGPNNFTSTVQNPTVSGAITNSGGTYTLLVSDANCTSSPAYVTTSVYATPPTFTLTPPVSSICIGGSQTISASIPVSNPTLNSGNQTNQNTASGAPAPYSLYYGGQKMQMLVLAGELSNAGFTTGSPIQSIQFPVVSKGPNWGVSVFDCQNFMVAMKATTVSALSVFETGLSNVAPATNFTPTVGYNNVHNFAAPFIWDGVSNLVIETVFSNSIIGTAGNTVIQYNSPTSFMSTLVYRADNQSVSSIAAATTSNTNVGFVRPDFKLNGMQVGTYSWSPAQGLSSTNNVSVVASPLVTSVYTVELSNGQCVSTSSITVNVISNPSILISTSASTVCAGNAATLTASGAASYTWGSGSHQASIAVAPFTSMTYTVSGSNQPCPTSSSTIFITAAPALTLATSVVPGILCQGDTALVKVSGASTYTWTGGSNSSSIMVSPSVTTNYTVNAYDGPGCWTTKVVNVKVNPQPIITVTPGTATICIGEVATFEASGVFNFTWSPGGSNSPIFTVSPVSSASFQVLGADLNNCKNTTSVDVVVNPCTGIAQQSPSGLFVSLYPNPSSGIATVDFGTETSSVIYVEDPAGKRVYETQVTASSHKIDLSAYAKGIYFVKVKCGAQSGIFKLVID